MILRAYKNETVVLKRRQGDRFNNQNLEFAQRSVLSQTTVFATWMLGHVFLALNFRSEKGSRLKLG